MTSSVSQAPFFSIVVPCYNRADIIPETVQAILRQEFQDFELILVDDGSTDGSPDILRQHAAQNPGWQLLLRPWAVCAPQGPTWTMQIARS